MCKTMGTNSKPGMRTAAAAGATLSTQRQPDQLSALLALLALLATSQAELS